MKNNPHPGFTMRDVAQELEIELGKNYRIEYDKKYA